MPGSRVWQMQDSSFYRGSCIWDSFYRGLLCRGRFGASSHLCDRNWCLCDGGGNSCYGAEDGEDGRTVNFRLLYGPAEMHFSGGMNSVGRNNPCGTEKPDRDESDWGKVIPVEQKRKLEMNPASGNNPCGRKKQAGDEFGRSK